MAKEFIFSFDCKSLGFFGEVFAMGYSVRRISDGVEAACGWRAFPPDLRAVTNTHDLLWCARNIPEEVINVCGNDEHYVANDNALFDYFRGLLGIYGNSIHVVVDCGYPVETTWLRHHGYSVYPLLDLSTMLLSAGCDPIGTYKRLDNEMPQHHPMMDARQTGRLFHKLLKGQRIC